MSGKIFTTEFDDNKEIYGSGETVSGRLIFVSDEFFNVDSVQVTFSGKAFVHWIEGGGETSTTYAEKQRLFEEEVCLAGYRTLPSGRSTFPFSFHLPQELPTSVEVSEGYVRYSVKGLVKRPGLHKNITTETIFTVFDVLDLNQVPFAKYPSSESDSKNLCCWSCASGPIEGNVTADMTGYVPGEYIKATGSIENLSNSDIRSSHFSIVQVVTKHAMGTSQAFPVELVKAPGVRCKRRSTEQIIPQLLQVPDALPQSHLRFCNVMDIEYFLQLTIYTGACHYNLRVKAPLVIGTIPLRDNGTGQPATASVQVNTPEIAFQPLASLPIASVSTANQDLPPSYVEATSVNIPREKDCAGLTTSAQQHNYYDWSQNAFTYK